MADKNAIEEVSRRITSATTFAAVFGPMKGGDVAAKKSKLRKEYATLAQLVHPDYAPTSCKTEAENAFRLLTELRRAAEEAITNDAYDRGLRDRILDSSPDGSELVSPLGTYRLKADAYRTGDFSVIYRASRI